MSNWYTIQIDKLKDFGSVALTLFLDAVLTFIMVHFKIALNEFADAKAIAEHDAKFNFLLIVSDWSLFLGMLFFFVKDFLVALNHTLKEIIPVIQTILGYTPFFKKKPRKKTGSAHVS